MQQAEVALLINAVQAMPSGGTLTVRTTCGEEELRLEIEDTGAGIPDAVLPHIFEPFYSTKEEVQGVGLGLAVVYGIVQRHGAEITVASREGEGTCFTLRLPREPRPEPSAKYRTGLAAQSTVRYLEGVQPLPHRDDPFLPRRS